MRMEFDPRRKIAVFLGPSLERSAAQAILPAQYYPPVRWGDVYRLLGSGVETIVLIDGVFHGSTPVWPREILRAIELGLRVVGASSMGALRAAELADYGMIGRGTIYSWYRHGQIDGDDEVALLHGDADTAYLPLSEPLVNLRYNLAEAARRGIVPQDLAERLVADLKSLAFGQRSYRALWQMPTALELPEPMRHALAQFLARPLNLKRQDAQEVLHWVAAQENKSWPVAPALEDASAAESSHVPTASIPWPIPRVPDFAPIEALARGLPHAATRRLLSAEAVLTAYSRQHPLDRSTWQLLGEQWLLQQFAAERRIVVPDPVREQFARTWATGHVDGPLPDWLARQGLTAPEYDEELAHRATAEYLLSAPPESWGLDCQLHRRAVAGLLRWWQRGVTSLDSAASQSDVDHSAGSAMPSATELLRQAVCGRLMTSWADSHGLYPPDDVAPKFLAFWEQQQGIVDRQAWLAAMELTEAEYRQLWAERAWHHWLIEQGPARWGDTTWTAASAWLRELQLRGELSRWLATRSAAEVEQLAALNSALPAGSA